MKVAITAFLAMTCASVLVGCTDDTAGSPPPKPMTEEQLNKQISAIQNNPNIPEAGKQTAIRQIKGAYEMMKGQSEGAGRNHKKPGS